MFCKLQSHALSKKTVLKIWLNPGLNLTIFLGTGPNERYQNALLLLKIPPGYIPSNDVLKMFIS